MESAIVKVRRRKMNGEIQPRKSGRRHPDWEYGYMRQGHFVSGEPTGEFVAATKSAVRQLREIGRAVRPGFMADVDEAVRAEVKKRLQLARAAAIKAFDEALGL